MTFSTITFSVINIEHLVENLRAVEIEMLEEIKQEIKKRA